MKGFTLVLVLLLSSVTLTAAPRVLSRPVPPAGRDLLSLLEIRGNDKKFSDKAIDEKAVSLLLYCAGGITRQASSSRTVNGLDSTSGASRSIDRTVIPLAFEKAALKIYAFTAEGAFLYNPASHSLDIITNGDFRKAVTGQDLGNPPLIILQCGDLSVYPIFVDRTARLGFVHAAAGSSFQNVNLAASALGLSTCPIASLKADVVKKLLRLSGDTVPLYILPVGYPR